MTDQHKHILRFVIACIIIAGIVTVGLFIPNSVLVTVTEFIFLSFFFLFAAAMFCIAIWELTK